MFIRHKNQLGEEQLTSLARFFVGWQRALRNKMLKVTACYKVMIVILHEPWKEVTGNRENTTNVAQNEEEKFRCWRNQISEVSKFNEELFSLLRIWPNRS